jgi:zinc transport system ATP-binding protein
MIWENGGQACGRPSNGFSMSLIKCEDLTLGYDTGIVVKDLNFQVNKGDYLCIVGENGSGKTTLVKALIGIAKPAGGRIIYGEEGELSPREIGYLPQITMVQNDFPASVREIVLSGCQGRKGARPFYNAEEKEIARRNMERVGITDLAHTSYRNLSGGQQQRVLLARALCAARKLLLLDEPVTGLDPIAAADMYQLIEELNDEGVTIIMISHDVREALSYATHILHVGSLSGNIFLPAEEYRNSSIGRFYLAGAEGRSHE